MMWFASIIDIDVTGELSVYAISSLGVIVDNFTIAFAFNHDFPVTDVIEVVLWICESVDLIDIISSLYWYCGRRHLECTENN